MNLTPKQVTFLTIAAVVLIVLANGLFVVRETQQALVLTLGKIDRVVEQPGLKFKIPFYQQTHILDKRILETDAPSEEVQAADKKRVVVDSFTRWHIVDAKKFYETVRTEDRARARLNTIVNASVRNVLGRYALMDVVSTNRNTVMSEILVQAENEAKALGVEIVDVRIKRSDLPEANANAVFARMRTEREKEAKEIRAQGAEAGQKIRADADKQRTILLAEAERDAQKLRGEGDASAIKIYADAFNRDPQFFEFVRTLEAYENTLTDEDMLVILDPSTKFLNTLQVGK